MPGPGGKEMDGPVFFLPGSIEHVKKRHFVVDYALLAIRIFDGLAGGRSVRKRESAGRCIDNGGQWVVGGGADSLGHI